MRVTDIPEIAKLSIPEKILLVEDLWDNISSNESEIPVPLMLMLMMALIGGYGISARRLN